MPKNPPLLHQCMFKRGRSHVGRGKQIDRKESKNKNGDNKTAVDDKRRERSTVSLHWPPVNLVKGLESRGEESKVKGMLRPPQPSSPSPLLLLSYLPQQNRAVGEEAGGGGGDKTPDVPSFDGSLPCQCILAFLPTSFYFFLPLEIPRLYTLL